MAVALVLDLLGAVGYVALLHHASGRARAVAPTSESHARVAPGAPLAGSPSAADGQRRDAAIRALLRKRAHAVLARDRAAFLATVGTGSREFRADQERLFDNLSKLPIAEWEYELASGSWLPPRPEPPETRPGVWTAPLLLRYRLAGFDLSAVTRTRYLTFARGPDGWRVTAVDDESGRAFWDLDRLSVVRRERVLVLGSGVPRDELRGIADDVDRAVPVVTRIWGSDWPRRAVVLVPRTQAQTEALSPDHQELAQIAALATVAAGPQGVPPPGTGDRIIVNPTNFAKLSKLGRRIVLTHELTHVASRALTGPGVPMWLVEGFADYVGYQGTGIPVRSAARELATDVRAGHVPRSLPTQADFAGDAKDLSQAYEEGWLACRLVAERYGQKKLVRLYRTMGAVRQGPTEQVQERSLHSVLDTTTKAFTADWRSYLRTRLG